MADDKTQTLANGGSFEERVLAQLAAIDSRLSSLEDKVEVRSRETRPIWEKALAEIMAVGEQVKGVDARVADLADRVTVMNDNLLNVRGKQRNLETRLRDIEEVRRPR